MTVRFFMYYHDHTCPGHHGDPKNCNCIPDFGFVSEQTFVNDMSRTLRRKKARMEKKAAKQKGSVK